MPIINGIPLVNESVFYDGKELPQDAASLADAPINTDVNYQGKTLPDQAVKPIKEVVDLTNNPKAIIIGGISLPNSSSIMVSGKKTIAESQIIDGVSVFEHISRKPYEIEFKFLIWDSSIHPVFPQSVINNLWTNVWLPNSVQRVTNTYLNGLGIQQIIIESIKPMPRLGSKNVDMVIKAYENQFGQTIIIPTSSIIISSSVFNRPI